MAIELTRRRDKTRNARVKDPVSVLQLCLGCELGDTFRRIRLLTTLQYKCMGGHKARMIEIDFVLSNTSRAFEPLNYLASEVYGERRGLGATGYEPLIQPISVQKATLDLR
jgi:hypothetical protein